MREWRELSAGRLLAIRREVLRETEELLRELLEGAGQGGGNPRFDWRRYQALRGGKT